MQTFTLTDPYVSLCVSTFIDLMKMTSLRWCPPAICWFMVYKRHYTFINHKCYKPSWQWSCTPSWLSSINQKYPFKSNFWSLNHHCPMVFPWFSPSSFGVPMLFTIFLWFFLWFSHVFYHFPMVFLWFSYGVPHGHHKFPSQEGVRFRVFTGAETPEPHKQLVGDAIAGDGRGTWRVSVGDLSMTGMYRCPLIEGFVYPFTNR